MRQAAVIGISSPCETRPRPAHLPRQDKSALVAGAVVVAKFGIVEGERDLSRVKCARAVIQYGGPPRIDISVRRRRAQGDFPGCLRECRDAKLRGGNSGVEAKCSCFGIVLPISGDDLLAVPAKCLTNQSIQFLNCHFVSIGTVDSADKLVEIRTRD